MSPAPPAQPSAERLDEIAARLTGGDLKGCCAAVYEIPAVRWLLADELHPGGAALTARALDLLEAGPGRRLLDVASGSGTSALLAAERGCEVVGLELGADAVAEARRRAGERGLADLASFVEGDAEALPFADRSFDAVLCECSLCTFPDKRAAVAEIGRVLRPAGRLALSDVVADHDRLPAALRGAMATVACVGSALSQRGYEELLAGAGFERTGFETADAALATTIDRVRDRLRGARLLGVEVAMPGGIDLAEAVELSGQARSAVDAGALGYAVFAARLPDAS